MAHSNAYFGIGRGPIFLDDVRCTLRATQLLECPSSHILTHDCHHLSDAGVVCEGTNVCLSNTVQSSMQLPIYCLSFANSSMCNWPAATGRREHWEWRQSGDLHEQCVGYCVWWLLGKFRCHCGVSTTGIFYSRSDLFCTYLKICLSFKSTPLFDQILWHWAVLTLVLVLVQFIWTMLPAVVMKATSLTVKAACLSAVTLATQRTLEWGVKVDLHTPVG